MNRETGEVEQRGRKVTLLTRVGFLQFSVPLEFNKLPFEAGSLCVVWLRSREWSFGGRTGHTFIFDSVADENLVGAIGPELLGS